MLDDGLIPQGASGKPQRLLLILQGMDTCGKDGVIKHVLDGLNPVGVRVASFDKPTRRELAHHFLWGSKRQVPAPGLIGVFNRSHYEDVLAPRVHEMVPTTVLAQRYAEINNLEQHLANHPVRRQVLPELGLYPQRARLNH
jgi:polyphosphate kinase 2 (PPK2 family)